ncbi:MAG TPA: hypothetical protein VEC37_09275, partial [Bacillota bacterium]|nr:hypothetical protein [Bacillota bacterium]
IEGPVYYQDRLWVGWQNLQGELAYRNNSQNHLPTLVQELSPLIRAYEIIHLAGLVIGIPDWERIVRTETGIHMPDPWIKDYLARPEVSAPAGLNRVFPPEISQGGLPDLHSDRFYLGLLLYTIICGKIPYSLRKGWPHGVTAGKSIPLSYYEPKLNPALAQLIDDLLALTPEERPDLRKTRLEWQEAIRNDALLATKRDYAVNLKNSHRYFTEMRVFHLFNRIKIPLGVILVSLALGTGLWRFQMRPAQPPEAFITEIFKSPATASPLVNPSGCATLIQKLSVEQAKRQQLSSELNSRPFVEIQSIKVLSQNKKQSTVALCLKWWTWENGRWGQTFSREIIILERHNKTWKLVKAANSDNFTPPK